MDSKTHDSPPTDDDLAVTPYINHQHPSIVALAKKITSQAKSNSPTEYAVLIHDYVRDSIPFGWSGRFWNETATDVLKTGRGFCNTKSTLFAALLRAVNIPCRLHFVDINTKILDGLTDPHIDYELHTYTHVYNAEKNCWCRLDSYIVDRTLAEKAKEKLKQEGKIIGYGVHRDGRSDWNGCDDTFIQYVTQSSSNQELERPLSEHDYGSYKDIASFYADANTHGRPDRLESRIFRWLFPLLISPGNRATEKLRK